MSAPTAVYLTAPEVDEFTVPDEWAPGALLVHAFGDRFTLPQAVHMARKVLALAEANPDIYARQVEIFGSPS